ncbi:MAG: IS66 family transposase [Tannerellaceae bacterium]
MEAIYLIVLPKNRIKEAIAYTCARVPRLKEYAQDSRILIDNNDVSQQKSYNLYVPTKV